MTSSTVHVAVFDTFADWETGYATAHIHRRDWQREPDRYAVATLGTSALLQGYATFPFMAVVFALPARRAAGRTALVWHRYRLQVAGARMTTQRRRRDG